jgi:hypothetical protein
MDVRKNTTGLDANLTGVILVCQRPHNLVPILAEAKRQGLTNFLIWSNRDAVICQDAVRDFPNATVLSDSDGKNWCCLGRYLTISLAPTEMVYCQDDDALPGDISVLADRWAGTGRVATYLDAPHARWAHKFYRLDGCMTEAYETLVGWGAVFSRQQASVLLRYSRFYGGIDDLLRREADRIFAMLQQSPHEEIEREIKHLPGAYSSDALYRQPDHREWGDKARAACRVLLNAEAACTKC